MCIEIRHELQQKFSQYDKTPRSNADLMLVKPSIFIGLTQPCQVTVADDLTVSALADAGLRL